MKITRLVRDRLPHKVLYLWYGVLNQPAVELWRGDHQVEITAHVMQFEAIITLKHKQLCDKGCCYR